MKKCPCKGGAQIPGLCRSWTQPRREGALSKLACTSLLFAKDTAPELADLDLIINMAGNAFSIYQCLPIVLAALATWGEYADKEQAEIEGETAIVPIESSDDENDSSPISSSASSSAS